MRDKHISLSGGIYCTRGMYPGAKKISKRQSRKRSRVVGKQLCQQQLVDGLAAAEDRVQHLRLQKAETQVKRYMAVRQELRQLYAEMEPEAKDFLFLTGYDCPYC